MKHTLTVSRIQHSTSTQAATIDGEVVNVQIPTLEVELYDPMNQHGSVLIRYRKPSEIEAALATFKQDEQVELSFSPVGAAQ